MINRASLFCIGIPLLLSVWGGTIRAATYHVSPLGSNTPPFDSYETAAHDPRDANALATGPGDTVYLHSGDYPVTSTIEIPVGVIWMGTHSDSSVMRWAGSTVPPITMLRALGDNLLDGIRILNPNKEGLSSLFGVQISSNGSASSEVRHCKFIACRLGIAIHEYVEVHHNYFEVWVGFASVSTGAGSVNAWIHHNEFRHPSQGGSGNGVYAAAGNVLIDHNVFDFRASQGKGTPVYVDRFPRVELKNNLLLGGQLSILWVDSRGVIESNTIVGSGRLWINPEIQVQLAANDTLLIRNNVFADFLKLPQFFNPCPECPRGGPLLYGYNGFWPHVDSFYTTFPTSRLELTETENFSAYPMFTDDSLYQLQYASPLIDAGDPSILDADGSRSDIGWTGGPGGITYEYSDLPPLPPESLFAAVVDAAVILQWGARPEADLAGYRIYRGAFPGFWNPSLPPSVELSSTLTEWPHALGNPPDSVYYVVTALDLSGLESGPSTEVQAIVAHRPAWTPVADQEMLAGDTMELLVEAVDPDGDPLTLTALQLPPSATLTDSGNGRGVVSFIPDSVHTGSHDATLIATDGLLADTTDFQVIVREGARSAGIVKVYPNPLSSHGQVDVILSSPGTSERSVRLVLYDVAGRKIADCFAGELSGERHTLPIDLSNERLGFRLATGVYFLCLQDGSQTTSVSKIAVVRQ